MNEIVIKVIIKLFTLIEGRIPQNVCKVFTVATIAGFCFAAGCLEGPYTGRAAIFCFVCLMLACFFGSMALMYEEVYED
jgi:hypothetical protein